jgi:hypothetical protein
MKRLCVALVRGAIFSDPRSRISKRQASQGVFCHTLSYYLAIHSTLVSDGPKNSTVWPFFTSHGTNFSTIKLLYWFSQWLLYNYCQLKHIILKQPYIEVSNQSILEAPFDDEVSFWAQIDRRLQWRTTLGNPVAFDGTIYLIYLRVPSK